MNTHILVESPNAPRPTGVTLEIANMLRRIENNYAREGSGPGSRFEGRLLEDIQAEAIVRQYAMVPDTVFGWKRGPE